MKLRLASSSLTSFAFVTLTALSALTTACGSGNSADPNAPTTPTTPHSPDEQNPDGGPDARLPSNCSSERWCFNSGPVVSSSTESFQAEGAWAPSSRDIWVVGA